MSAAMHDRTTEQRSGTAERPHADSLSQQIEPSPLAMLVGRVGSPLAHPNHPTADLLRRTALLGAQRQMGNAFVQRWIVAAKRQASRTHIQRQPRNPPATEEAAGSSATDVTYPLNVPDLPPAPTSCADAPAVPWAGLLEVATFSEELAALYADRLTTGSLSGVRRRAAQQAAQAVHQAGRLEGESRADFRQRIGDVRDAAMTAERAELREREHLRRLEHLREDFAATVRNASGRRAYRGEGSLNVVARGWMVGQRERLLFETEMRTERGRQIPVVRISPPEDRREFEPLARGSGPAVDPRLNRFIDALDRRHPGLSFSNYHGHGGGEWKDRGLSIDISIRGRLDERGFYDPNTAVEVLRAVHETASGLGGDWRALYNDFRVARVINRETGAQRVRFVGTPGGRLNWHGPLVLHIHIDYQPPPSAASEAEGTAPEEALERP